MFQQLDVSACNGTEECQESMKNLSKSGILPVDINLIDYDVNYIVDSSLWGDKVRNISSILSSPPALFKRKYKTKLPWRNTPKKIGSREEIRPNKLKEKLAAKYKKTNISYLVGFDMIPFKKPFKAAKKYSNLVLNVIGNPKSTKRKVTKSQTSNITLDDLISRYAVIKKRSISNNGLSRRHVASDSSLMQGLRLSKRRDRRDHDSFSFFSEDSNEDIDPVPAILDGEFLFGGSKTQHEGTTPFPIVDKDYDYDAEYEYGKASSPSEEEEKSEETYEEDKEETVEEYNEEPKEAKIKPKENINAVKNVVKQDDNQEDNENEEGEDEDEDVIREPPIIVLYKGGDSKQLQPSFEYALTHGGLDPRYLSKEPLAGPLATQGFNHNFQVMRGVPIQGNVMQPGRRYPTVGGFNTTQIHAIIQTGRFPPTTMSGNNNATIGVVPVAPADHVSYARPVNTGQFMEHPHPGNSQYITRPTTLIARPNYYPGRGRGKPTIMGRVPYRSPSGIAMTNTPRFMPSYRGGHMLRYRGNRNHMARYRPINVPIPRGTRLAIF